MKDQHILFSNYFWEEDENSMDKYDYAREYLFAEYAEDEEWESEDEIPDERVAEEVYQQVKGLKDAGLGSGFITWNSGSNYSKYVQIAGAFSREY